MTKICIDAGHGLKTAGKRCMKKLDPEETREWFLNNRIADKLENLLKGYKCEILRVDDTTGIKDVSLANRIKKANEWKADIYISIHHNAGLGGRSGGGTVVFYCSDKPERAAQAKRLYNNLVGCTGLIGNRAQKVIKKGFDVIKKTTMPAFLIENGFMDSKSDVPVILSEEHANLSAQGILNFLVKELSLSKKVVSSATAVSSFKVKVKVDALNVRSGPGVNYKAVSVIKDKGTYTIIKTSGSWGYLKSGTGWINISDKYVTRK